MAAFRSLDLNTKSNFVRRSFIKKLDCVEQKENEIGACSTEGMSLPIIEQVDGAFALGTTTHLAFVQRTESISGSP